MVLPFLLAGQSALGQDTVLHPAILGTHFIVNRYSPHTLHSGAELNTGLALSYLQGFCRSFDWSANLNATFANGMHFNYSPSNNKVFLESFCSVRGRLRNLTARFKPYLEAGAGVYNYARLFGTFGLAGAGAQVRCKNAYLLCSAQIRLPLNNNTAPHIYGSIGIAGIIMAGKRRLKRIECMQLQEVIRKIQNADPDPLHVGRNSGVTAIPTMNPDSDNDGIPDTEDACPFTPGLIKYKGCPAPDDPKEGSNRQDSGRLQPSPLKNNALPLMEKNDLDQLDSAVKNVQFETGSYAINVKSCPLLRTVIELLKKYPEQKILIEGHTDNQGTAAKNILLSEERAKAVRKYLIRNGISQNRLSMVGYGALRPWYSNSTARGRAGNRRVIIKLIDP